MRDSAHQAQAETALCGIGALDVRRCRRARMSSAGTAQYSYHRTQTTHTRACTDSARHAVARCVFSAGDDAHAAASAVVEAAVSLWDNGGYERRDDVTVVVVMFAWPSTDAASATAAAGSAAQLTHPITPREVLRDDAPGSPGATARGPAVVDAVAVEVVAVPTAA